MLLLDSFLICYLSSKGPSVLQPLRGCRAGLGSGCIGNYGVIYKLLRSLHNGSPERSATIIMIRLVVETRRGSASAAPPYAACRIARSHAGLPSVPGLMQKHVSGMQQGFSSKQHFAPALLEQKGCQWLHTALWAYLQPPQSDKSMAGNFVVLK